jgi:hypothetical protein
MSGWSDDEVASAPVKPSARPTPADWKPIPASVQRDRDGDRMRILQQELELNPNDQALRKEIQIESRKQGVPVKVADKAVSKKSDEWGDDEVASAPSGKNSVLKETARQLGLTGRYALEGVASVPAALGNVMEKIGVKGAGGNVGTRAADYLGLPTADREGEKVVSDITQTLLPGAGAYKGAAALVGAGPGILRAAGRNIGGGAAAGAASNAALDQDIGEGALYGAALGPVVAGAGNAAKAVYQAGARTFGGAANRAADELRHALGPRTAAAVNALRNLHGNVAGEMPTAGRAASAELPELKILEDAARQKPGAERYLLRDQQNEAARLAAVERHAAPGREGVAAGPGQPVPLSPANEARLQQTRPMYEQADPDRVVVTPELRALLDGAEVSPIAGRGARSFSQDQTNAFVGGRQIPRGPVEGVAPTPAIPARKDALGVTIVPEVSAVPGKPATHSIQDLQSVKDQLTSQINKLTGSDLASVTRRGQLTEARNQLTQQMSEQSPAYAAANTAYRDLSAPINQAAVAKELVGALRNSKGTEQAGAFLSAMENAPQTIKRAGVPRFQQIQQVATPGQMSDYNAVAASLRREADYAGLQAPEGILPRYMSPLEKIAQRTPGVFSQIATIGRSALKQIGRQSDEQVFKVLNDAMLDPNKMADLLERIPPAQRTQFLDLMRSSGANGAITGITTPAGE